MAATHCFGAHLSVAGGLHNAIQAAVRLKMNAVQVFVKNQRQWQAPPLDDDGMQRWESARASANLGHIIAHGSYLINLASADAALAARSRVALTDELLRCERLGIPYLVFHPGSAGEQPVPRALRRVADALNRILDVHPRLTPMPLLETTAGQGRTLGRSFEELADIIGAVEQAHRVGVCVDTCHVFAAGYDIRTAAGYAAMIDQAQRSVGIERIRCWHLNDSRCELGSCVDRHEHIGRGRIGAAGFRHVLNDARFRGLPMILETPKGLDARGRDFDALNLSRLRRIGRTDQTRRESRTVAPHAPHAPQTPHAPHSPQGVSAQ